MKLSVLFLLPIVSLLLPLSAPAPAQLKSRPAYEKDPEYQKLQLQAQTLERNPANLSFAADAWKKANMKAGGHCMDCFEHMVLIATKLHDNKHAMEYAHGMAAAAEQPGDTVRAKLLLGRAVLFLVNNKKPDAHLLEEAHSALQEVEPATIAAYYLDGRVLALLHHDEEAGKDFAAYAEEDDRQRSHADTRPALCRKA